MAIEVNDSNFESEVLKSEIPVLVDFWASWCMPCQLVAPSVEAISAELEGKLKVCKVNVDEAQSVNPRSSTPPDPDLIAEENTKPVFVQSDEKFTPETFEDEFSDQTFPDEMPEELIDARMLMENEDYSGALEAISSRQDKSQYHDEIRSWFLAATESETGKAGEAWEAVGDLELSEDNHEAALDAYAKAIGALLDDKKVSDEAD